MTEFDFFKQVLGFFDSTIALAIAVWIINVGINRLDKMQTQHQGFVEKVLGQQQENNNELMGLVSTLCISPRQEDDPPKSLRRGTTKAGL